MNFNKLALDIYEQNKAVGWWDDPDRCMWQTLQLVSTEIAEATEGERKNLMDDHLPSRKMGEVELADALIRLLDVAGRYNWGYVSGVAVHDWLNRIVSIGGRHLALNDDLTKLAHTLMNDDRQNQVDNQRDIDICYSRLVNGILHVGLQQGYDLFAALFEKSRYNAMRQDHKRENREQEHGKKF